jgi:malate dehydrogenase (oxaloacetate-decarboxylating)(NADP+)
VLRAVQTVVDEHLARPILVGRRAVVAARLRELDLRLRPDVDFQLCDPEDDPRYNDYWKLYFSLMSRRGVSPEEARLRVRTNTTIIAALMVKRVEADALICGVGGGYAGHLAHVQDIIGLRPGVHAPAALNLLILNKGTYFICDTHVTAEPTTEEVVEMALVAANELKRFGIEPKVALLSHSNFGSRADSSAIKMRDAARLLHERAPDLEVEGEMQGDAALSEELRLRLFPDSKLKGTANLLVMPSMDAANIAFNLLKSLADGISVGPMLVGMARPAHIATSAVTVERMASLLAPWMRLVCAPMAWMSFIPMLAPVWTENPSSITVWTWHRPRSAVFVCRMLHGSGHNWSLTITAPR